MAKTSLEFALEEYLMALFRTDARLKGKHFAHGDADGQARMNGITVQATKGEPELEGVAGFNAEVIATWRGGSQSTAARNDLVAAAMTDCVMTANTRMTAAQLRFATPLIISTEAMTSERPDTKNSRKRVIKIPCIAKLA